MNIFFEILVRIAGYGPKIDQSHGENRLGHIIIRNILWKQFRRFSPSFTVSKQYVDKAKAKLSKILLRNVFLK